MLRLNDSMKWFHFLPIVENLQFLLAAQVHPMILGHRPYKEFDFREYFFEVVNKANALTRASYSIANKKGK